MAPRAALSWKVCWSRLFSRDTVWWRCQITEATFISGLSAIVSTAHRKATSSQPQPTNASSKPPTASHRGRETTTADEQASWMRLGARRSHEPEKPRSTFSVPLAVSMARSW